MLRAAKIATAAWCVCVVWRGTAGLSMRASEGGGGKASGGKSGRKGGSCSSSKINGRGSAWKRVAVAPLSPQGQRKRLVSGMQDWDFKAVSLSAPPDSAMVKPPALPTGRGRGAKRSALYSSLATYCTHFSGLISEELKNEKSLVYGRLATWSSQKLADSGYAVLGLSCQPRGRLYKEHIVRFTLPHRNSKSGLYPDLGPHKFAPGDVVVVSTGKEPPSLIQFDDGEGSQTLFDGEGVMEGVVLERGGYFIDIALDRLPEGSGARSGRFRLDQVVNGINYDRQFEALKAFTDPKGADANYFSKELGTLFVSTFSDTVSKVLKAEGRVSGAGISSELVGQTFQSTGNVDEIVRMAQAYPAEMQFSAKEVEAETKKAIAAGRRPLNSSQAEAVRRALKQRLTLIQGPPGTGKTESARRIILAAVQLRRSRKNGATGGVLACAFSNVACDNLLQGCVDMGLRCVRIGHPATVRPELREWSLEGLLSVHPLLQNPPKGMDPRQADKEARRSILTQADVVVATCVGSGSPKLIDLGEDLDHSIKFSTLIIDEATQATEPSCLVPLMRGCQQLVLLGDQNQLPPTVLSTKAKQGGLGASLFSRLILAGIVPVLLKTQYRMHPAIANFPSRQFYGGNLENFPRASDRVPPRGFAWPDPACPVAFLSVVSGKEERSGSGGSEEDGTNAGGFSYFNRAEIDAVFKCVTALMEGEDVGKEGVDIGIISPYSAQMRALTDSLQSSKCECEIKTVDAYQGREKEVVIISAVRSNPRGSVGFLADWRRLNVAITRARRGVIVIGDPNTLQNDRTWAAYIAWCSHRKLIVTQ